MIDENAIIEHVAGRIYQAAARIFLRLLYQYCDVDPILFYIADVYVDRGVTPDTVVRCCHSTQSTIIIVGLIIEGRQNANEIVKSTMKEKF